MSYQRVIIEKSMVTMRKTPGYVPVGHKTGLATAQSTTGGTFMLKSKVLSLSGRNALARDVVAAVLELRGHDVVSMKIGSGELTNLAGYDLIVLEIDGTVPDAFMQCRRIRNISKVPLLLLIPPASRSQGVRGLDLGADGYIVMPVDRREFVARVEALIRRSKARR